MLILVQPFGPCLVCLHLIFLRKILAHKHATFLTHKRYVSLRNSLEPKKSDFKKIGFLQSKTLNELRRISLKYRIKNVSAFLARLRNWAVYEKPNWMLKKLLRNFPLNRNWKTLWNLKNCGINSNSEKKGNYIGI